MEVKELTGLFRDEWKDIQQIAEEHNLPVNQTYLLSFIEPDEGGEICLFYNEQMGLFLYSNENGEKSFKKVEPEDIKEDFPQLTTLPDIANFNEW